MATPVVPAASFPIPPPLAKLQFTNPRDGILTIQAISFLTQLWAGIQGGGGIYPSLQELEKEVAILFGMHGDGTLSSTGVLTVTGTQGVPFGYFATGTDASNLTGVAHPSVIPIATTLSLGGVIPDGTTITVLPDGTISSTGGSGGLPPGGATGTLLYKVSGADDDAAWSTGFYWDAVNGRLGLGTSAPGVQVELNATGQTPPTPTSTVGLRFVSSAASFSGPIIENIGTNGSMLSRRTNGTFAAPTALLNADIVFRFLARGYDGASYPGNSGTFGFRASENWTNTAHGMQFEIQATPVGSTSIQNVVTVMGNSHMALGPSVPAASAAFDLQATDGAFLPNRLTTTQKLALTPTAGMIVQDTTLGALQTYENGAWGGVSRDWQPQGSLAGTTTADQQIFALPMRAGNVVPTNMTGSIFKCAVAPTANTTFVFQLNGANQGTVEFLAGHTTSQAPVFTTFTSAGGDIFSMLAPHVPDVTFAGLSFLIIGTRTQ
jgi:hypothetical protein